MDGNERFPHNLPHPVFLVCLLLLVANDLVLKPLLPGPVTGKLSDVAGLLAFGWFWCALWPRRTRLVLTVIGAGFVFWNSPLAQGVIDAWNRLGGPAVGRTVDPWDDLALLVLPAVPLLRRRCRPLAWRPVATGALVLVSLTAFLGTSRQMTVISYEANPPDYQFNCTKAHFLRIVQREGLTGAKLPDVDTPLAETIRVCPGAETFGCAELEVAEAGGRTHVWLIAIDAYRIDEMPTADALRSEFEAVFVDVVRQELDVR